MNNFVSKTLRLEWKSGGAELAWIGYARIAALRVDRFDNHYFASNQSVQNTTNNTDTDFLTLTQTPLALPHAIIPVAHCNPASTTVTGYLNIHKGSREHHCGMEPREPRRGRIFQRRPGAE